MVDRVNFRFFLGQTIAPLARIPGNRAPKAASGPSFHLAQPQVLNHRGGADGVRDQYPVPGLKGPGGESRDGGESVTTRKANHLRRRRRFIRGAYGDVDQCMKNGTLFRRVINRVNRTSTSTISGPGTSAGIAPRYHWMPSVLEPDTWDTWPVPVTPRQSLQTLFGSCLDDLMQIP